MPIGVCQTCRSTVRFEGSAGLCPNCGTVLRAGERAPRTNPPKAGQDQDTPVKGRVRKPLVNLDDIDVGEDEEAFEPAMGGHGKPPTDPVIFYLAVGAGAVIVVFGIYVALRSFLTKPDAPIAVAPPANPPTAIVPLPEVPGPEAEPVAPPATQPAAVAVVHVAPVGPPWSRLIPAVPIILEPAISDKSVGASITKAVGYLKSRFGDDELLDKNAASMFAGGDALCVYALMHAGEAIHDPDLQVSSEWMRRLINRLKQYDMSKDFPTYQNSLRLSALAMFHRPEDLDQLNKDRDWLLKSEANGAYDYSPIQSKSPGDSPRWDNSNSQYGLLGIWAAALAGLSVPDKYWSDVEQHWLGCQNTDGGWTYSPGPNESTTSMTAAGVTALCVAADQRVLIASKGKHDMRSPLTRAIDRGIDWLGDNDHVMFQDVSYRGYGPYGIERAALATGYRFFGVHDWYREIGAREIKQQKEDGSWPFGNVTDESREIETAFRILFLSRGRQPLLMNKLRFEGDWNDRPRDVAKLSQFVSAELEKPFAWGVADLSRDWQDWMECPLLFITTDAAPEFTDTDCKKLRAYTDAGGMIFVHNEYSSPEVDGFVKDLVKRTYPEFAMTKVLPNNLINSAVFPIKTPPILGAVGNGVRTFLLYSPKDLTQDWVRVRPKDSAKDSVSLQIALNLAVIALGKSDFRNRLDSPYEPPSNFPTTGTLPLFQISYPGNWNPEPKAYERFSRWFAKQTGLKLDVQPTSLLNLDWQKSPVAVLTGTGSVDSKNLDLHGLHDFVTSGGVLFVDPAGGSAAFADSVQNDMLRRTFPGMILSPLPPYHPVFTGGQACMDSLPKPRLRNYATSLLSGPVPEILTANVGKGTIIVTPLDVTTGLLSSSTYAINGYTPSYCQSLMKNVILWGLSRFKS